jgi:thiol:disulfide interchange protein
VAPEVTALLKQYVIGELWTDRVNPMDAENNKLLNEKYGAALPLYLLFTSDGKEIARIGGRPSVEKFVEFLNKGLKASAPPGGGR